MDGESKSKFLKTIGRGIQLEVESEQEFNQKLLDNVSLIFSQGKEHLNLIECFVKYHYIKYSKKATNFFLDHNKNITASEGLRQATVETKKEIELLEEKLLELEKIILEY